MGIDESPDNICPICGGILRIAFTITFEQCQPRLMQRSGWPPSSRLCPGHPDANDTNLTTNNRMFLLESFLVGGLYTDGSHHKQWALYKIAEILGFKQLLEDIEDKGIAP